VSDVVETQFGYHIIKVDSHDSAGTTPEAEVAPRIKEFLTGQKTNAAVQEQIAKLRKDAKVEVLLKD
jgi:parvulin-like peptidyl-prolyl isomerase